MTHITRDLWRQAIVVDAEHNAATQIDPDTRSVALALSNQLFDTDRGLVETTAAEIAHACFIDPELAHRALITLASERYIKCTVNIARRAAWIITLTMPATGSAVRA